jgi:acetyl esterase/lipase
MTSRIAWLVSMGLVICGGAVRSPAALAQAAGGRQFKFPDTVVVEHDIEYGKAGDVSLKLDMLRPKAESEKPLPVIAFIHGGGWSGGDKAGALRGQLLPYAASGNYLCVSINYRLSGEAIWPAQIEDCKAAIRFLRANAEKYHIDPRHIGVWGSSAGGHLVSLLGTSGDVKELEGNNGSPGYSSRVTCVVDYCGPSSFVAFADASPRAQSPDGSLAKLFGGPVSEKRAAAVAASPVTYASADDPPFLIVHGLQDPLVPLQQAELLDAALEKAGVSATFVKCEGAGHALGGTELNKRVALFFDKNLRGKNVEVSESAIPFDPDSTPRPRPQAQPQPKEKS